MGHKYVNPDDGMVDACPECDYATPKKKRTSFDETPRSNPEPYYCDQCGAHFEEPNHRPRKNAPYSRTASSVANALIDADPETEIRLKERDVA